MVEQGARRAQVIGSGLIGGSIGLALLLTGLATLVNRTQFAAVAVPTKMGEAPVGAVLKRYGDIRRLTWDTWRIYLKGFARLCSLDADVMIASRAARASKAPNCTMHQ